MRGRAAGKVTYSALLVTAALMLSYLETLVPLGALVPIPNFKLGFSNIAVLCGVLWLGSGSGFCIFLCKTLLTALLFGGVGGLPFALCGGFLAWGAMAVCKGFFGIGRRVSVLGTSVLAAACHNTGQVLAAVVVMGSGAVWAYLPALLVVSVFSGGVTGLICGFFTEKLWKNKGLHRL